MGVVDKHRPRSRKLKQDFEGPLPPPGVLTGVGGAGCGVGGGTPAVEPRACPRGAEFPSCLQERPSRSRRTPCGRADHTPLACCRLGNGQAETARPPGLALGSAEGPGLGIQRVQIASNPPARRRSLGAAHPSAPPTAGTRL